MKINLKQTTSSWVTFNGFKNVYSPERSAQLVIVHIRFGFALAPAPGHLVGIRQLELPVRPLPRDAVGVRRVGQQLQQELP